MSAEKSFPTLRSSFPIRFWESNTLTSLLPLYGCTVHAKFTCRLSVQFVKLARSHVQLSIFLEDGSLNSFAMNHTCMCSEKLTTEPHFLNNIYRPTMFFYILDLWKCCHIFKYFLVAFCLKFFPSGTFVQINLSTPLWCERLSTLSLPPHYQQNISHLLVLARLQAAGNVTIFVGHGGSLGHWDRQETQPAYCHKAAVATTTWWKTLFNQLTVVCFSLADTDACVFIVQTHASMAAGVEEKSLYRRIRATRSYHSYDLVADVDFAQCKQLGRLVVQSSRMHTQTLWKKIRHCCTQLF